MSADDKAQEWGFESPMPGLMYVTRNALLFETMLAGAPEGTVPYTRFAGEWFPAPYSEPPDLSIGADRG